MAIYTTSAIRSNTMYLDAEKVLLSVCAPADPELKNYIQLTVRIDAGAFMNPHMLNQYAVSVFPSLFIQLDNQFQKPGEPFFIAGNFSANTIWENTCQAIVNGKKSKFRNYKLGDYAEPAETNTKMVAFCRKVENFSAHALHNELLIMPDKIDGNITLEEKNGYTAHIYIPYNTHSYENTNGLCFKIQAEVSVLLQSEFSSTKRYESIAA